MTDERQKKRIYFVYACVSFISWIILLFTLQHLDVGPAGPAQETVGLAGLNEYAWSIFGENVIYVHFADIVFTVSEIVAMLFLCLAIRRFVIGQGIKAIPKGVCALLIVYLLSAIVIIIFKKIDLETGPQGLTHSYMHPWLVLPLVIMPTAMGEYHVLVKDDENTVFAAQGFSLIIIIVTIVIRTISGQFWFTDIAGASLFSIAMFYLYKSIKV